MPLHLAQGRTRGPKETVHASPTRLGGPVSSSPQATMQSVTSALNLEKGCNSSQLESRGAFLKGRWYHPAILNSQDITNFHKPQNCRNWAHQLKHPSHDNASNFKQPSEIRKGYFTNIFGLRFRASWHRYSTREIPFPWKTFFAKYSARCRSYPSFNNPNYKLGSASYISYSITFKAIVWDTGPAPAATY